ncbi:hypothetical protein L3X38_005566 [Prunus dulcis]|uniref:Uncharacterized protein n=1 Tax=Prunus dulcis TaxID=3755 RepID=A0AAD4ZR17_PRUDU|nr:hypothetical protein L3X38_005566 [Prunus dulcis]
MVYNQAYNIIIGRTALTGIKAHLSPHIMLMKFLTYYGTGVIRRDQLSARTCYATTLKSKALRAPMETLSGASVSNDNESPDDPKDETLMPQARILGYGGLTRESSQPMCKDGYYTNGNPLI